MQGVAAFLRLVYAPDEAADYDSLAIADEAGCLHEAALWAHKLDAPRLLRRIAAYMEGARGEGRMLLLLLLLLHMLEA